MGRQSVTVIAANQMLSVYTSHNTLPILTLKTPHRLCFAWFVAVLKTTVVLFCSVT